MAVPRLRECCRQSQEEQKQEQNSQNMVSTKRREKACTWFGENFSSGCWVLLNYVHRARNASTIVLQHTLWKVPLKLHGSLWIQRVNLYKIIVYESQIWLKGLLDKQNRSKGYPSNFGVWKAAWILHHRIGSCIINLRLDKPAPVSRSEGEKEGEGL